MDLFESWSPEYALNKTIDEIKVDGLAGLKKHLTANALQKVNSMESLSDLPGVSLLTNTLMGGNAVKVLLEKLSECNWTVKDVMKGSDSSRAILGFNYQDKMTGTVEMKVIKEDKVWKIDDLETPKFEKFELPQPKSEESAK
ncbi:MAG: hypothetical protein IJH14_07865 [Solobacterium sp.]|nr:hypothetical protein [Solobacterium sp.]